MNRRAVAVCVLTLSLPVVTAGSSLSADPLTARDLLSMVDLREESTITPYKRSAFKHWVDADRNCRDARQEVLSRDSSSTPVGKCKITRGSWVSWLDGKSYSRPAKLQIDHLVPLAEAWTSGSSAWSPSQRSEFANDLDFQWSLQAVTGSLNASKGEKDPAQWLPAGEQTRCLYAQRWLMVKYRWNLSIDSSEQAALNDLLIGDCGDTEIALPAVVQGIPDHSTDATGPTDPTIAPGPAEGPTAPPIVSPRSFCASSLEGSVGVSKKGVSYTCKRTVTDGRLRWRK